MYDRCVSCGAYVPEGRMVCPSCEAKAKEQTIKIRKIPLWRKIIAFFMGIIMCFTFAACSNIFIKNNAILAFSVSEQYDGCVYIIAA